MGVDGPQVGKGAKEGGVNKEKWPEILRHLGCKEGMRALFKKGRYEGAKRSS